MRSAPPSSRTGGRGIEDLCDVEVAGCTQVIAIAAVTAGVEHAHDRHAARRTPDSVAALARDLR